MLADGIHTWPQAFVLVGCVLVLAGFVVALVCVLADTAKDVSAMLADKEDPAYDKPEEDTE